ncbi:MAG TPA: MBL fold metallo-hydrolase [Planctomycetota bacterium]|nr:MBL fold metallo-hydrolase [Planctomycetota bacterium]
MTRRPTQPDAEPLRFHDIQAHFLAHVAFLFRSRAGTVLLTDPMFAGAFEWQGHIEQYLSPPAFPPEAIAKCDLLFVSHIHGDHYDPDAIARIRRTTGCRVLGPPEVVDDLCERGEAADGLVALADGQVVTEGDLSLTAMAGYDDSADARGRPNKFSALITCGETTLFYGGDCHEVPPALRGRQVSALFWWPHDHEATIGAFAEAVRFPVWVLMHGDRFHPGSFLCNLDLAAERRRVQPLVPHADVIVPKRLKECPRDL